MLGKDLIPCLESSGHIVTGMVRGDLDVTNYLQVMASLSSRQPELVIHCAAYTKVDQAEAEPDLAFLVNGYGTENLAVACNHLNIPMLYISTDYVFDGEKKAPTHPGIKQDRYPFTERASSPAK